MIHRTRTTFTLLSLPLLALGLTACDDSDDPNRVREQGTIVEVAQDAGSFTTLLTALNAAGLTGALEDDGPFTVFAPTDEAFAAIDPEVLADLLADPQLLTAVLTYHVVAGSLEAADVAGLTSASTLNGKLVNISVSNGMVMVDGATVTATDIRASNGIIHVIDKVILPGPIADIVQVARGAGSFTTLLTALDAAGLTDVLKSEGPFTVFAPTDAAFAAVPADALSALLQDQDALTAVLTYHVAPGSLDATQVLAQSQVTTVNGAAASISIDPDGSARIDDAVITATDIGARNGVIHVIDRVIFPE